MLKKHLRIYWSDIKLFLKCSCCFYVKHKYGLWQPQESNDTRFGLYKVADKLLKEEFDLFRGWKMHPLINDIADKPIDAMPFNDEQDSLNAWRNPKEGIQFFDENNNTLFCGIIDDIWISSKQELIIVDYKTITCDLANVGDNDKYQISFYTWVLKNSRYTQSSNYTISETAYLIYYSVLKDGGISFLPHNLKLEFKPSLVACRADYDWVEKTLSAMYECLNSNEVPATGPGCSCCKYRKGYIRILKQISTSSATKKF